VDRVWQTEVPDGSALHRLAFVPLDEIFLDLVDHPATLPVVTALLGWNIYLYHCHLDVHPPLRGSGLPVWRWHQDGGRQNLDLAPPRPRLSVKVAYFLTDVRSADDGAMLLIPGSHTRDVLERPTDGSVLPVGSEPLLVRAGSAVVFDRRLWHARGDNLSSQTRKVLSMPTRTAGSTSATTWHSSRETWLGSNLYVGNCLVTQRARSAGGYQPTTTFH